MPDIFILFDSSNAVLGMAFTPPHPLEKVIAFCTAEMNFVLDSKQNKNKDRRKCLKTSKVVKKGRKKIDTKFEKGGKKLSGFRGLPRASTPFFMLWYTFTYFLNA